MPVSLTPNRPLHKRRHSPSPLARTSPKRSRRAENVTPFAVTKPDQHMTLPSKKALIRDAPLAADIKEEYDCTAPLKSSSNHTLGCPDHITGPAITPSTLHLYINIIIGKLATAARSICARDPLVTFVWGEGSKVLRDFATNEAKLSTCAMCDVEDLLDGRGGLNLLTGILILGKEQLYVDLLAVMSKFRSAEHIVGLDHLIRQYAAWHAEYLQN
jgi:hypothetical protein